MSVLNNMLSSDSLGSFFILHKQTNQQTKPPINQSTNKYRLHQWQLINIELIKNYPN